MSLGFNKVKIKNTSSSSVKDDVKKDETTSSSSVKDDVKKDETTSSSSVKDDVKKDETTSSSSVKDDRIISKDNQYVIRTLDQMKVGIDEAAERARSQIPSITNIVNEYQKQTIQASEDLANDFLRSQKDIINSIESVWIPVIENFQNRYWSNCMSPQRVTEVYARSVNSFTDFALATSRLINNTMYSNLETFKIVMHNVQENAKEFSRISTNAAKTLGP
jgi:hypothetical protein